MYLISEEFKKRIRALSKSRKLKQTRIFDIKQQRVYPILYMTGIAQPKQKVLKLAKIPGWLMCAWCLDKPVTEYWKSKVVKLGNALKLKESKCLEEI